jgi:hypothetical protein
MELTPPPQVPARSRSPWPNTITFPKELRDAIPTYAPRALVFDSVSGSHYDGAAFSAILGRTPAQPSARANLKFLVHETGKLNGMFELHVDLDTETARALGKFLVDLADQAESGRN